MIWRAVALGVFCALTNPAQGAEKQPYQWVGTLESVLEEIARGSEAAEVYLPTLIKLIAEEIEKTDPKVLLEKRNLRAVLVYALSGGDSKVIRKIIGLGGLPSVEEGIAKGALAYSEGKYSTAAKHLDAIDARSLDIALAPRVALTQAILIYKINPKRAIELLDTARLLGTGTLIEEAAMRREIVLLGSDEEFERFRFLSEKYLRKYGNSLYSGYFAKQFSMAASSFDYMADKHRLGALKDVVEVLQQQSRRLSLYLLLAENAIGLGNVALAKFAAENSQLLSTPASSERSRSELYLAAAKVASEEANKALSTLESLAGSSLKPSDAALLDVALAVGREVAREPVSNQKKNEVLQDVGNDVREKHGGGKVSVNGGGGEQDEIEQSARKAIASANKILRGEEK